MKRPRIILLDENTNTMMHISCLDDLPGRSVNGTYVYAIGSSDGRSKIGITKNPRSRIKLIIGHSGVMDHEVYITPRLNNAREIEYGYKDFSDIKPGMEWFRRPVSDITAHIVGEYWDLSDVHSTESNKDDACNSIHNLILGSIENNNLVSLHAMSGTGIMSSSNLFKKIRRLIDCGALDSDNVEHVLADNGALIGYNMTPMAATMVALSMTGDNTAKARINIISDIFDMLTRTEKPC